MEWRRVAGSPTWRLAALLRLERGEVQVPQVVGTSVQHVALERPLDVAGVRVVGDEDRVFTAAVVALEADLLGRTVGFCSPSVEVARLGRVPP